MAALLKSLSAQAFCRWKKELLKQAKADISDHQPLTPSIHDKTKRMYRTCRSIWMKLIPHQSNPPMTRTLPDLPPPRTSTSTSHSLSTTTYTHVDAPHILLWRVGRYEFFVRWSTANEFSSYIGFYFANLLAQLAGLSLLHDNQYECVSILACSDTSNPCSLSLSLSCTWIVLVALYLMSLDSPLAIFDRCTRVLSTASA